jgi:hypothetical protein
MRRKTMMVRPRVSDESLAKLSAQDLRERCLKLALEGDNVGRATKTVVDRAKAFEAFVTGEKEEDDAG